MTARIGAWAALGEPRTTAALTTTGVDWVCLDAQHGHFDDRAVRESLALAQSRTVPVLVRLASSSATLVGRALDAGADGVIAPLVQDEDEAASVVRAAHHPPTGTRSFGPLAGVRYPERPFVAVMVETQSALDRVEQIAATPGLDMIFVGPFDLSLALGREVDEMVDDARDDAPLRQVLRACANAAVDAGAYGGNPERAARLVDLGFTWVAAASDADLLSLGAQSVRSVQTGSA